MHCVEFQISDVKDALTSLYGVRPKIQCLPPQQVRRAPLSFLFVDKNVPPFQAALGHVAYPGAEVHVRAHLRVRVRVCLHAACVGAPEAAALEGGACSCSPGPGRPLFTL